MESKLQRILEVLRLTPSKEKPFECESDGSPSVEKKQNIMARFENVNDNSIMTDATSRDGNIKKRHVRKYGVPCKFYPRSHSLETQPAEKNFNVDSTDRFALRRNSSLDSDTERFCMRYEGTDKSSSEFDDLWRYPRRENSMTRSNEEFNERKLNEKQITNTINCRSQELFNAKSCYETETDCYEEDYDSEWKRSMSSDFLIPKISSNTCSAMRNLDCNKGQLRSACENKGQGAPSNPNRGFKEMVEDHLQEDISSYERWIAKSKFTGQVDAKVENGRVDQYSYSSSRFDNEKQELSANEIVNMCGNITDERAKEKDAKPIKATYDNLNMRESSARFPYRLRRQDGMDAVYDADAAHCGFYVAPNEDSRRWITENVVSLSGNAASLSGNKGKDREVWQDQVGKCEIRILHPFPETIDRNENAAYPQYEDRSRILGSELIATDYQEPNLLDDSYGNYAMEKDFRFMQGKTSRRSMKLRRDSPFAFPLIEEFARKSNSFSDGYYKKRGTSSMQGRHFSGSIGYFLESQKIGEKTTK